MNTHALTSRKRKRQDSHPGGLPSRTNNYNSLQKHILSVHLPETEGNTALPLRSSRLQVRAKESRKRQVRGSRTQRGVKRAQDRDLGASRDPRGGQARGRAAGKPSQAVTARARTRQQETAHSLGNYNEFCVTGV